MADAFIGASVNKAKLDEMYSRNVLLKNETLEAAIWGAIESSRIPLDGSRNKTADLGLGTKILALDKRSGLIGLTNQRLIFYMPKMLNRYEFEAFAIKQIDSVVFTKGMRKGRINVSIVNNDRVIKGINNEEGQTIVEMIQNAIQAGNEQQNPPPATAAQSPMDLLKTKYVNGEITEEEYEKKKSILES